MLFESPQVELRLQADYPFNSIRPKLRSFAFRSGGKAIPERSNGFGEGQSRHLKAKLLTARITQFVTYQRKGVALKLSNHTLDCWN